jgi:hypothetical protein
MNFSIASKYLINIFNENDFQQRAHEQNFHSCQKLIQRCANHSEIIISYPGYKSKTTKWGMAYDYRVDLAKNNLTTSLSHANIITDIYNKILSGGMSAERLKEILIDISMEGNIDLPAIVSSLNYTSTPPDPCLIDRVNAAHNAKSFNRVGNSSDLTIEELLGSIKWIVLQEDINYPITKGLEGRKMPLARYLETIFITHNNSHALEEVISRALSHSRPPQWSDMDYSFLQFIR